MREHQKLEDLQQQLLAVPGVEAFPPLPSRAAVLAAATRLGLPPTHADLLGVANGLHGYGGHLRLLGVGDVGQARPSIEAWNDHETWQFAWSDRPFEFLCFAETGWGDQYAYRRDELRHGDQAPVWILNAIDMNVMGTFGSFLEFLREHFLPSCTTPIFSDVPRARAKVGDLASSEHVVHVPSILIAGDEDHNGIAKMSGRAAMIVNGDLARQTEGQPEERAIAALQPYVDQHGRMRLRVIWAD